LRTGRLISLTTATEIKRPLRSCEGRDTISREKRTWPQKEACKVSDDEGDLPSLIAAIVLFIVFMGFQLWLMVHSIAPQLSH
jgi:hypothetical protein